MVSTLKNSKAITRSLTILSAPVSGASKINVSFDSTDNIFVGKKIKFKTTNDITITGVVGKVGNNFNITITSGVLDGTEFTQNSSAVFFETFTITKEEDNAHVSFSDIHQNLLATSSVYENGVLISEGTDGLYTGEEKSIVSFVDRHISIPNMSTINNLAIIKTLLCNVVVPKNRLFKHTIAISGDNIYVQVSIRMTNVGLTKPKEYVLTVDKFSTSEELKGTIVNFTIENNVDSSLQNNYLAISAIFDNSYFSDEPDERNYTVTQITSRDTIFHAVAPNYTNKNNLEYNLGVLYQDVYSDVFKISDKVESYSYNGVIYNQPKKTLLAEFTDLNEILTEGEYYMHNGDVSTIINKPNNDINQRFDLSVKNMNLNNSLNEYFLSQTFTNYAKIPNTQNWKLDSYVRISYVGTGGDLAWSVWYANSMGGHTHSADDISQTDLRQFVTTEEKTNWNKINTDYTSDDYTWKLSVATIAELPTKYPNAKIGWCSVVKETNTIFKYNGTTWENTERIVSAEINGLISKEQFTEYFIGSSQSKMIEKDTKNYINRHTENPLTIYGENYQFLFRNNIDLINRTVALTEPLGDYSYQQGFDVLMSGNNSFGIGRNIRSINFERNYAIGYGLLFGKNEQIIFGSFNISSNTDSFIIGDGEDENTRSNLFSISRTGTAKIKEGYSVEGKTRNDILVADGTTITRLSLLTLKVELVWDATIVPLPPQTFTILDNDDIELPVNENTLFFVNGVLLLSSQYTITAPNILTIIDELDNGDTITIK